MKQVTFQDDTQAVDKSVQSRLVHFLASGHLIGLLGFSAAQGTPVQHQVLPQPHPVQPLHVLDGRADPTGLRL